MAPATEHGSPRKRVLIVDDSDTSRILLARIIDDDPRLEVVGVARDGREALERVADLDPDVVVMDVEMPVLDGLAATREIMGAHPAPIIVVTGSLAAHEVDVSMEAQLNGAVLSMLKPPGPASPDFERRARHFRRMVRLMADVSVVRRRRSTKPRPAGRMDARVAGREAPSQRPRTICVAASTGGPAALVEVLAPLPADFSVPVLVVQHIAEGFATGLARWLDVEVEIDVRIAENGQRALAGHAYIAPDTGHLEIGPGNRLVVSTDAPVNGFRPSADRLFASLARTQAARGLAVILTGMGTDGVHGLQSVREAGGWVIAQDEATSVIWGMPRAAVDAGVADEVLPVDRIGAALVDLAKSGSHG